MTTLGLPVGSIEQTVNAHFVNPPKPVDLRSTPLMHLYHSTDLCKFYTSGGSSRPSSKSRSASREK
jgi:hypothetical protein